MKSFGWDSMGIELCGNYAPMSWYVQPATAPVSCGDYLKCELPWHKCITHVICSFKNSPSLPTRSGAFFCHWLCCIFLCATQSLNCSQLIPATTQEDHLVSYTVIFVDRQIIQYFMNNVPLLLAIICLIIFTSVRIYSICTYWIGHLEFGVDFSSVIDFTIYNRIFPSLKIHICPLLSE